MSPRMPWEAVSAEPLKPLKGVDPPPQTRSGRRARGAGPPSARSVVQQPRRREALQDAIRRFKADVDIRELLERRLGDGALRRVARTNGGEWAGPCPLCGGEDRLRVWPTPRQGSARAWCRRCRASGDALAWTARLTGRDPRRRGDTTAILRDHGLM